MRLEGEDLKWFFSHVANLVPMERECREYDWCFSTFLYFYRLDRENRLYALCTLH
jgi:hypothetical protein